MKSRPILFSGAMVRAILAGTKTQTRRIVNPQPAAGADLLFVIPQPATGGSAARWAHVDPSGVHSLESAVACPYGVPGDSLWVRESLHCAHATNEALYTADNADVMRNGTQAPWEWQRATLPSIHMPRWACRIALDIVSIRVERVQDISQLDAMAEGTQGKRSYAALWDLLNAKRGYGWDANPWVWVIEFTMVQP